MQSSATTLSSQKGLEADGSQIPTIEKAMVGLTDSPRTSLPDPEQPCDVRKSAP